MRIEKLTIEEEMFVDGRIRHVINRIHSSVDINSFYTKHSLVATMKVLWKRLDEAIHAFNLLGVPYEKVHRSFCFYSVWFQYGNEYLLEALKYRVTREGDLPTACKESYDFVYSELMKIPIKTNHSYIGDPTSYVDMRRFIFSNIDELDKIYLL